MAEQGQKHFGVVLTVSGGELVNAEIQRIGRTAEETHGKIESASRRAGTSISSLAQTASQGHRTIQSETGKTAAASERMTGAFKESSTAASTMFRSMSSSGGVAAMIERLERWARALMERFSAGVRVVKDFFGGFIEGARAELILARTSREADKVNQSLRGAAGGAGALDIEWGKLIRRGLALLGIWKLLGEAKSTITGAGAFQADSFGLTQLIGNATIAQQKIREIEQLSTLFKFEDFSKAAQQLLVMGTGLDNLVPRLESFAKIAARTSGATVEGITSVYGRMVEMLKDGTAIGARQMIGFQQQGLNLVQILSESTGKSSEQVREMFDNNRVSIEMVNKAIHDFTTGAGVAANALEARANTWQGLLAVLADTWSDIKREFGTPIIETLSPILKRWLGEFSDAEGAANKMGQRVAQVIKDLDRAAQEGRLGDVLSEKLSAAMDKLGPIVAEKLEELRLAIRSWLADNVFTIKFEVELAKKGFEHLKDAAGRQLYGAAYDNMHGPRASELAITPPLEYKPDPGTETPQFSNYSGNAADNFGKTGTGPKTESDWDKYKTDVQLINDYWEEYALIQSKAATETERTRRVQELQAKTAEQLVDPGQYEDAIGKVNAFYAEKERIAKITNQRIERGEATLWETVVAGIEKAKNAIGTWQQNVSDLIGDVATSIGDGFTDAFVAIIDGTKSASDAFRDMAVSVLRDIERMIVRMLVMQAIKAALNLISPGAGNYVQADSTSLQFRRGGEIHGPSHAGGGVPIEAEGGEYIIRKDRVRNEGIERMAMLNEGRATIIPKYGSGGKITDMEPPFIAPRGYSPGYTNPTWPQYIPDGVRVNPNFYGGTPRPLPSPMPTATPRPTIYDPDLTPEAYGKWYPTHEPLPIPVEPDHLPGAGDVTVETPRYVRPPIMTDEPTLFDNRGFDVGAGTGLNFGPGIRGNIGMGNFPVIGTGSAGARFTLNPPVRGGVDAGLVLIGNQTNIATGTGSGMASADLSGVSGNAVADLRNWIAMQPAGSFTGGSFGGVTTPSGMTIVGIDTQSAQPVYQDAAGNLYVNPGTGAPIQRGNMSGVGHNAAAHAAMIYSMSQSDPGFLPFASPDELGFMDTEGMRHMNRFATPMQLMAAAKKGTLHRHAQPTITAGLINAMRQQRMTTAQTEAAFQAMFPLPQGGAGGLIWADNLPRYHDGGVVGEEMPIMAKRGERVIPVGQSGGTTVASGAIQLSVTYVDGKKEGGTRGRGGVNEKEAKELQQMLEGAMDEWARKQSRHGGALSR